jgi:hypothetical protein
MAEPERDRWGRYKLPHPETGERRVWTRTTKLASTLDDSYGLNEWDKRMVVYGIGKRLDLADLAAASDLDDVKQLTNIAKQAKAAARADERANKGTALHKYTERVDRGLPTRAAARWEPDIAVYTAALEKWEITTNANYCERITIIPQVEVAGTMDKIVSYKGVPTIADLKTGGSVEKGLKFGSMKIAMQLAIYSRGCGLWNMDADNWEPMPNGLNQDIGIIIHLPAGEATATLYEVDLKVGWAATLLAYRVSNARKYKKYLAQVGESVTTEKRC